MTVQFRSFSSRPSRRVDAPDAAVRAGFDLCLTGGTVMLRKDESDGQFILLGHIRGGAAGDPADRSWNVGRYSDAHEGFVEICGHEGEGMTLAEAIDASVLLPELDAEQRSYDTIGDALSDRPSLRM